jgi:hypothetical protein
MRTYEKEVKGERGTMILKTKDLKKVHTGDDVWVYGRHKKLDNVLHMVIYGPKTVKSMMFMVKDKSYTYYCWDRRF